MQNRPLRYFSLLLALCLFYAGSYLLSAHLNAQHGTSVLSIHAGVALGLMLRFGANLWPALLLASLTMFFTHNNMPITTAIGLSLATTTAYFWGVWSMNSRGIHFEMQSERDFHLFIRFGLLFTPIVKAIFSFLVLLLTIDIPLENLGMMSAKWLLSDIAGILIISVPIMCVNQYTIKMFAQPKLWFGIIALFYSVIEGFYLHNTPLYNTIILVPLLAIFWIANNSNLSCSSILCALFAALVYLSSGQAGEVAEPISSVVELWVYVISVGLISLYTAVHSLGIRRSLKQHKHSIEYAQLGTWDWQLDTQQVQLNHYWYEQLGMPVKENEANADLLFELVHPADEEMLRQKISQYLRQPEGQFQVQFRLRHQNGSWRNIISTGEIIEWDVFNQPVRFCGIHRDITDELEHQHSLQQFQGAIEQSPIGFLLLNNNPDLTVCFVNEAYTRISGFRQDDVVDRPFNLCELTEQDPQQAQKLKEDIFSNSSLHLKQRCIRQDGRSIWCVITIDPVITKQHNQVTRYLVTMRDISDTHKQNQLNEQHNIMLGNIAAQVPGAMFEMQIQTGSSLHFSFITANVDSLFGLSSTQLEMDAQLLFNVIHPDDVSKVRNELSTASRMMSVWRQEFRVTRPQEGWRESHAKPTINEKGEVLWYGYFSDISERKRLETELRQTSSRLQSAQQHARLGYWSMNLETGEIYWSNTVYQLTGRSPQHDSFLISRFLQMVHEDDLAHVSQSFEDMHQLEHLDIELRIVKPDGQIIWLHKLASVQHTGHFQSTMLEGTVQDITERKNLELKLANLALTDELSGIANRRAFINKLEEAWLLYLRNPSYICSVIILDIDYFKRINDSHGHEAGDAVLKHITQQISEQVRKSDCFGRLGGEEFGLLLRDTRLEAAYEIADKLRESIESTPLMLTRKINISATASFGVAEFYTLANEPNMQATDVLFSADKALYEAKNQGRNRVKRFVVKAPQQES